MTTALLRESFYALKRGVLPGVDGIRWQTHGITSQGEGARIRVACSQKVRLVLQL
jgi:hypothetical protein